MLIDFVPTTNGLSLAEAPAFKKAAGGAPANVAVGIARLGGSSAFIGKVTLRSCRFDLYDVRLKVETLCVWILLIVQCIPVLVGPIFLN